MITHTQTPNQKQNPAAAPAARIPGSERVNPSIHPSPWLAPGGNATVEHSSGKDRRSDVVWYYLRTAPNPQSARICLRAFPELLFPSFVYLFIFFISDVPADRWRAPLGAVAPSVWPCPHIPLQAFVKCGNQGGGGGEGVGGCLRSLPGINTKRSEWSNLALFPNSVSPDQLLTKRRFLCRETCEDKNTSRNLNAA